MIEKNVESAFFTSDRMMIFVGKFANIFGENKTIRAGGKYFRDTGKRKVHFQDENDDTCRFDAMKTS